MRGEPEPCGPCAGSAASHVFRNKHIWAGTCDQRVSLEGPGGLTARPQPVSGDEVTLKGNLASDSSLHNEKSSGDVGPGAGEETGVSLFALHARGS